MSAEAHTNGCPPCPAGRRGGGGGRGLLATFLSGMRELTSGSSLEELSPPAHHTHPLQSLLQEEQLMALVDGAKGFGPFPLNRTGERGV